MLQLSHARPPGMIVAQAEDTARYFSTFYYVPRQVLEMTGRNREILELRCKTDIGE